jgi:two-component system CheB/CheR fusion protein
LIDSRRHQFKLDLPRDPLWVQADPTRLEQVVVNLLNNAAKYTDDGGRIELSLRTEGDWLSLAVTDTGLGIEPDMLPQIFDLFTQGSRSLDRSQGGLGIGLSLVQRLVEMHGGSVGAASGGLGKGSRFTVRLPLLGSSQPMTARAPVAPNKQPLPKCRVLVVDDNVDAAETMAMLAKISGHEVRIAHAGTTALEAAASFLPNVALLDIGLPGLDGYEVARRLRVNPKLRNLRLIAITGYGQQSDIDLAYEAGFHHHLVKPVQFSDMAKLLVGLDEVDTTSPIV